MFLCNIYFAFVITIFAHAQPYGQHFTDGYHPRPLEYLQPQQEIVRCEFSDNGGYRPLLNKVTIDCTNVFRAQSLLQRPAIWIEDVYFGNEHATRQYECQKRRHRPGPLRLCRDNGNSTNLAHYYCDNRPSCELYITPGPFRGECENNDPTGRYLRVRYSCYLPGTYQGPGSQRYDPNWRQNSIFGRHRWTPGRQNGGNWPTNYPWNPWRFPRWWRHRWANSNGYFPGRHRWGRPTTGNGYPGWNAGRPGGQGRPFGGWFGSGGHGSGGNWNSRPGWFFGRWNSGTSTGGRWNVGIGGGSWNSGSNGGSSGIGGGNWNTGNNVAGSGSSDGNWNTGDDNVPGRWNTGSDGGRWTNGGNSNNEGNPHERPSRG